MKGGGTGSAGAAATVEAQTTPLPGPDAGIAAYVMAAPTKASKLY